MAFMTTAVAGLLGAGTATAGAAATTGISISSILQGIATVGGVVASIAAGNAEGEKLQAEGQDALQEKGLETLQSVERKRGLLKAAQEAVGQSDTAYAASGVDLSFGSAQEARTNVFREADLSLNSESATTAGRLSRLDERAQNLFRMASGARRMGILGALTRGASGFASIADQV